MRRPAAVAPLDHAGSTARIFGLHTRIPGFKLLVSNSRATLHADVEPLSRPAAIHSGLFSASGQ